MSKYINAETLIEMLNAKADMAQGTPKAVFGNVIKMIDLLPPADAVEVVRCKNCRMAEEDLMIDGWYYCNNNDLSHKPNHFCSYGERKESNEVL